MTLQKSFGKPIFWLASKHHVLEQQLNKVFSSLAIVKSKKQQIKVFKIIKNFFF